MVTHTYADLQLKGIGFLSIYDLLARASSKGTNWKYGLTLEAPTPQNGQTHSNNLPAAVNELFESLTSLWGGWCLKG